MVAIHLCTIMSAKPKGVRAEENTEVIFENMQLIADYLVEMRKEIRKKSRRELHQLSLPARGETATTSDDSDIKAADCADSIFQVEIEILQPKSESNKSVFALSTLNGALVDAIFAFWMLDATGNKVAVDFEKTELEPGLGTLRFPADADHTKFLIMKASPVVCAELQKNSLLSFA